jgi:hypothetical protein
MYRPTRRATRLSSFSSRSARSRSFAQVSKTSAFGSSSHPLQPGFDALDRQEARARAVDDVVQRIGRVVRPVHDLALDALEGVPGPRHVRQVRRVDALEGPAPLRLLLVVEEVVIRRRAVRVGRHAFAVQGLVFEHTVKECACGRHTARPAAALEDEVGEDAQCLRVALEAAVGGHQLVELALADMAEGRVTQVVRVAHGLHEVGIRTRRAANPRQQHLGDRPRDARHFQRVRQPRAVEVVLAALEDLRLRLQTAKRVGKQHTIAIDLERRARVIVRARFARSPKGSRSNDP